MQKTILNIKKVALAFFIITGFIHLGSSILIANGYYLKESLIINKVADIPFIITGLIYGFAALRLSLTNQETTHKVLDTSLALLIVLVLTGLILVNILLPDLNQT